MKQKKKKTKTKNHRKRSFFFFLFPAILTAKDQRRVASFKRTFVGPSVIGGALTTTSATTFLFIGCIIVFHHVRRIVIVTLCLRNFKKPLCVG